MTSCQWLVLCFAFKSVLMSLRLTVGSCMRAVHSVWQQESFHLLECPVHRKYNALQLGRAAQSGCMKQKRAYGTLDLLTAQQ